MTLLWFFTSGHVVFNGSPFFGRVLPFKRAKVQTMSDRILCTGLGLQFEMPFRIVQKSLLNESDFLSRTRELTADFHQL